MVEKKEKFPFAASITQQNVESFITLFFNYQYRKTSDKVFISQCREIMTKDPITGFCTEIIFLYMFSIIGQYSHDSKRITKDLRGQISSCKGSWSEILRRMASCYWYGYSWSQIACSDTPFNRKSISEIHTYDPLDYDFVVKDGKISKVTLGLSGKEIDYNTGVHLVVGIDKNFDYIFGCGRVESALPYWELHKLLMPVLALASQRQAQPILVKKTETGEDVLLIDQETGKPVIDAETGEEITVKKGWDSVQQLVQLGVAGVTAIDKDDEIFAIDLMVNGDFLLNVIKVAEQYRMVSLLVPVTLFSITNNGVGDAGLAKTHLELFRLMILSMAEFMVDEIVEKLFRPIIIYNYGEQENYGNFVINLDNPLAMEIAQVALTALDKGFVELADLEMINRIRQLIGISPYDDEGTKKPLTKTPVTPNDSQNKTPEKKE
jgi:hypothetical protein